MLLGGGSCPVLLVVSQLAYVRIPLQLSWRTQSGLDFVLEPIRHGNHIIRKKAYLLFSKFKISKTEKLFVNGP